MIVGLAISYGTPEDSGSHDAVLLRQWGNGMPVNLVANS